MSDSVASVRLHAVPLLPLMKGILFLPDDVELLSALNAAAAALQKDESSDIAQAARAVSDSFMLTKVGTRPHCINRRGCEEHCNCQQRTSVMSI